MSHITIPISRIIRAYGMKVIRRPRNVTIDGDDSEVTYGDNEELRAMVTMLTGSAESYEHPGIFIKADALLSFAPSVFIFPGDLVLINDEWFEVKETINRYSAGIIDWVEAICNRRNPV